MDVKFLEVLELLFLYHPYSLHHSLLFLIIGTFSKSLRCKRSIYSNRIVNILLGLIIVW